MVLADKESVIQQDDLAHPGYRRRGFDTWLQVFQTSLTCPSTWRNVEILQVRSKWQSPTLPRQGQAQSVVIEYVKTQKTAHPVLIQTCVH